MPRVHLIIALCPLQLMSLLRDYDVLWPAPTITLFSYSDSFNLGISITAPECYIKGYTFFTFYIATMAMPVRQGPPVPIVVFTVWVYFEMKSATGGNQ